MNNTGLGLMLMASMLSEDSPDEAYDNIQKVESSRKRKCLPKRVSEYDIPGGLLWKGITKEMEYREYSKIQKQRVLDYTLDIYNRLGIQVESEYDYDNYYVILPEGWEKKSTDHSMWFDLIDNKGNKRARIFEKAFDESFISFETRYIVTITDVYSEEITIYLKDNTNGEKSDIIEQVVFKQKPGKGVEIHSENIINRDKLKNEYKEKVKQLLPDFDTDPIKYWD